MKFNSPKPDFRSAGKFNRTGKPDQRSNRGRARVGEVSRSSQLPQSSQSAQKTSWGKVADWYDSYLEDGDSYQKQVILPNLMRVLDPKPGEKILDIACGQGYFTEEIANRGAHVVAFDISPELIRKAERRFEAEGVTNARVFVGNADNMKEIRDASIDSAVCVLAAQNIEHADHMIQESARVLRRAKMQDRVGLTIKNTHKKGIMSAEEFNDTLKNASSLKGGKLVLVLNHPSFRIPKDSDWHFEEQARNPHQGKQGRVVYRYLSEGKITIDMNPGMPKERIRDKVYTVSYHRPLQVFVKWLTKNGFVITRIEEWSSHKKSATGPRQNAEDTARKEIPLFMCIEASLLG
jgi:ubiquinone/menaquinone biosynthesis C-methylase UbiE